MYDNVILYSNCYSIHLFSFSFLPGLEIVPGNIIGATNYNTNGSVSLLRIVVQNNLSGSMPRTCQYSTATPWPVIICRWPLLQTNRAVYMNGNTRPGHRYPPMTLLGSSPSAPG